MSIVVAILLEIILLLILALKWVGTRYLTQRKTIQTYLESESLKPPNPKKISKKNRCKVITHHLKNELALCEERFSSLSPEPETTGLSNGEDTLDLDTHIISVRHALLSAELEAIDQQLKPLTAQDLNTHNNDNNNDNVNVNENDKTVDPYWDHFSAHLRPLLTCFETLKTKALQENDRVWQTKLLALEQQHETDAKLITELERSQSATEDENRELQQKIAEILAANEMIQALDEERQHLDAAIHTALETNDNKTNKENKCENITHHVETDVELNRLKERSYKQQKLIKNLLDTIESYRTTASNESGVIEITETELAQLQGLQTEAEQLNKMIKESEVIIHMLEGEIETLTKDTAETHFKLAETNNKLSETEQALEAAKAEALDRSQLESLESELEQAQAMQMTLIRSNSDYAAIIHFIRQSLEGHSLQKIAEELLQIYSLFSVEGAVQISTPTSTLNRDTDKSNSYLNAQYLESVNAQNGFIKKDNATMLCFPNIKMVIENMDKLEADDRDRLQEIVPIIGNLSNQFINNLNNEKEIELNRSRLKQTIVAVHQSARNLDIRLKLFFKESAQGYEELFDKLKNESFRFKLEAEEREAFLSSLNQSIKLFSYRLEKSRENEMVKSLIQSVEPALKEIRSAKSKGDTSGQA